MSNDVESMSRTIYYQMMREYVSLRRLAEKDSSKKQLCEEKYKELQKIGYEKGYRVSFILNEVIQLSKSNKKTEIENPLTLELCEKMIEQFVREGRIYSRTISLDSSKKRGRDEIGIGAYHANAKKEAMDVGLRIFLDNIKRGNIDKVSEYWKNKIDAIGISKLEKYLQTGICEDDYIKKFLYDVMNNCYNIDLIGSRDDNSLYTSNEDVLNVFRIYFNMPKTKESIDFIKDYQIKCQELEIPYNMKAFENTEERADVTIFYSTYKNMNQKLKIIKELLDKYPNIEFGTPPNACAKIKGLENVGLCHCGLFQILGEKDFKYINCATYNDYVDRIAYLALFRTFGGQFKTINEKKIEDFREGKIRDGFSGLILQCPFNKDEKERAKKIIAQLISDPFKKKILVKDFKDSFQMYHDTFNGYPKGYNSNIALDMWYLDMEKQNNRGIDAFDGLVNKKGISTEKLGEQSKGWQGDISGKDVVSSRINNRIHSMDDKRK